MVQASGSFVGPGVLPSYMQNWSGWLMSCFAGTCSLQISASSGVRPEKRAYACVNFRFVFIDGIKKIVNNPQWWLRVSFY